MYKFDKIFLVVFKKMRYVFLGTETTGLNPLTGDRPMEYLRIKIKTREEMMINKLTFGE